MLKPPALILDKNLEKVMFSYIELIRTPTTEAGRLISCMAARYVEELVEEVIFDIEWRIDLDLREGRGLC